MFSDDFGDDTIFDICSAPCLSWKTCFSGYSCNVVGNACWSDKLKYFLSMNVQMLHNELCSDNFLKVSFLKNSCYAKSTLYR